MLINIKKKLILKANQILNGEDKPSVADQLVTVVQLKRIISEGEIKNALIELLQKQPDDENTHLMCLYFLRCMNNPFLLYDDMTWLEEEASRRRKLRVVGLKLKSFAWTIVGLTVMGLVGSRTIGSGTSS